MPTPGSPRDNGFRKTGPSAEAEADGLAALAHHVRVPRILEAGKDFIVLERLELRRDGDWTALGRMLAKLHRQTAERYGWHRDNYIGATPQQNGWCESWLEFWRERRLRPQLELAKRNGFTFEISDVERILEKHQPPPSLLHGDLWNGNAGFIDEGPVIFDPAVYYGDREADLAMTELFGGFARGFYEGYSAEWPLAAGYEARKHLYNLYHLLNHLNLFGSGYRGQVERTLRLLREGL